MTDPVHLIPLPEIDPTAIARDRTGLAPEPQAELERSIAAAGLRQPVELFPLAAPDGDRRYGLLTGFRRLHAFRTLLAATARTATRRSPLSSAPPPPSPPPSPRWWRRTRSAPASPPSSAA